MTATATKPKTIRLTTRERAEADAFWDSLSETGHADSRGGAEYIGAFKSDRRIREYARTCRALVANVARTAKQTTTNTN
jgi:hypothetical protein